MSAPFQLNLDPFGKLIVRLADGTQHVGAVVVRAFPIAAPQRSISILSPEGKELVWIDDLAQAVSYTHLTLPTKA